MDKRFAIKCKLCGKIIEDFNPELNRLEIDENCFADICKECVAKFSKWQGKILAELFPTAVMKKWHRKKS